MSNKDGKSHFFICNCATGELNALMKQLASQLGVLEPEDVMVLVANGTFKLQHTRFTDSGEGVIYLRHSLVTDGSDLGKWFSRLHEANKDNEICHYTRTYILSQLQPTIGVSARFAVLRGSAISQKEEITITDVCRAIRDRGWSLPTIEQGLLVREHLTNADITRFMGLSSLFVPHEPCKGENSTALVMDMDDYGLSAHVVHPSDPGQNFINKEMGYLCVVG